MPVEEFESATSNHTPCTHTDSTSVKDAWIFQTPSQDLLEESQRKIDKLIQTQDYILVPFLEDDIDPYEWSHTLSTIDVCALPPQTQFRDEYGYEVVPVRVISIANIRKKYSINLKVPSLLHKVTPSEDLASLEYECTPFRIPLTVITQ